MSDKPDPRTPDATAPAAGDEDDRAASRRNPPSVDSIVRRFDDGSLPRPLLTRIARSAVKEVTTGEAGKALEERVAELVRSSALGKPRRVINATGVLLHTNLGRAPWSAPAREAATGAGAAYGNLELDLASGERGRRGAYVDELLVELSGAEAALVVNNNAAAVLLTLSALARGGSVAVSRGELIEIGGSYRLPELMAASGIALVEIGTTNRTRLADYAAAVDETTGLLLKVHPSNYRIVGFSEETSLAELAGLAADAELPLVFDAGSGLLDASTPWLPEHPPQWLAGEPGIRQSLESGADLVLFSGDKLLGGPQAGIVVGRRDLVDRLRSSPLARALRIDGATMAALAATLEAYANRRETEVPLWRMAATGYEELEERASKVLDHSGAGGRVVRGASTLGGGSVPGSEIPSPMIELAGPADDLFAALLDSSPPVLARRAHGRVLVDLRAVDPEDDQVVAAAIAQACR